MCNDCSHCHCTCNVCSPDDINDDPLQGPNMENGDFIFHKSMLQLVYEPMIRQQLEASTRMYKMFNPEEK
jgi:hypothetical protein